MGLIIQGMTSQLGKVESQWEGTWLFFMIKYLNYKTVQWEKTMKDSMCLAQNNFCDPWTLSHITSIVRQLQWQLINFKTHCKRNFLIIKLSMNLLQSLTTSSAHLALAYSFPLQTTLLVWLKALFLLCHNITYFPGLPVAVWTQIINRACAVRAGKQATTEKL